MEIDRKIRMIDHENGDVDEEEELCAVCDEPWPCDELDDDRVCPDCRADDFDDDLLTGE
jgi:hypothetical protein